MIDQLIGRPSANIKRFQVIAVALIALRLFREVGKTKTIAQRWDHYFRNYSSLQLILGYWLATYIGRNLLLLLGLNAPEPFARMYSRSFYRTTWFITAFDVGYWTAMGIRPRFLREICSLLFSFYYLVNHEAAEEKKQRIRLTMTVEQMRVAWSMPKHPLMKAMGYMTRPKIQTRRHVMLDTHPGHPIKPQTSLLVLHAGRNQDFKSTRDVILHFPGGGFVSMDPECHEEYLLHWAKHTDSVIVSVDYGKAPEFPYPWAIEECFKVYETLVQDNGKCIGLDAEAPLNIALVGDSAGGNLAAVVMLKIIEQKFLLPKPVGMILIYPVLEFNITSWMSEEDARLLRTESSLGLPNLLQAKDHLSHERPLSVSDDKKRWYNRTKPTLEERVLATGKSGSTFKRKSVVSTRLMMTSRVTYFNDRMLSADLMRAMAILYIGPNKRPDFSTDYHLSPLVAPESLLAQFPPLYLLCGERDPLVDDSVLFAGKVRAAKRRYAMAEEEEDGIHVESDEEEDCDGVRIKLIRGLSHGFMHMGAAVPEAAGGINCCSSWFEEIFSASQVRRSHGHQKWVNDYIVPERDLMDRRRRTLVHGLTEDTGPMSD